jgi:hypothetical protein
MKTLATDGKCGFVRKINAALIYDDLHGQVAALMYTIQNNLSISKYLSL